MRGHSYTGLKEQAGQKNKNLHFEKKKYIRKFNVVTKSYAQRYEKFK